MQTFYFVLVAKHAHITWMKALYKLIQRNAWFRIFSPTSTEMPHSHPYNYTIAHVQVPRPLRQKHCCVVCNSMKCRHVFNLLKSFTSVFILINIQQWWCLKTSKNVSLAQKSGCIFKNSCALMVIIVVNFENMNNIYIATTKRSKKERRILVKDPIDSNFLNAKWVKQGRSNSGRNIVFFNTIFRKALSFYIKVEQIVAFGN